MPTQTVQTVTESLNQQLANWNVLYIKLHNYHWYVKGPQFFTLHAKFQELYQEAALHIDEIAERILTIKGQPLATMKDYLAVSNVVEATGTETADQMVQTLVDDFDKVLDSLKNGMEIAQKADDETTSDMLLAIFSSLEKHQWMLRAYLGRQ